jgi:SAM-dependent methyltransferase
MCDLRPLIRRLGYTGKPSAKLSASQLDTLRAFKEECERGVFSFERADCLCDGNGQGPLLLGAQDRYGLPVNTYFCQNCGMLWSDPRMTADSLARFYDEYYRSLYVIGPGGPECFFHLQCRRGEDVIRFLQPEYRRIADSTVFDVGCATGGVLAPFVERGARAYGCDYTTEYLQRGQQAGLNVIHGSAEVLREYGPANLIVARHVLEHCPDPVGELNAWSSLLARDGYLYVEVPSVLLAYEVYGDLDLFLQNAHLYHFTLRTLEWLLSRVGFQLVKGNQTVRALFVRRTDGAPLCPDASEAERILRYIRQRERVRWLMRSRRYILDGALRAADKLIGGHSVDGIKRLVQRMRR